MTTQPVEEVLVGFARALRAAGVAVTADRTRAFVEATSVVGVGARASTRAAGRATLCSGPDDLDRFDRVFDRWFGPEEPRGSGSSSVATTTRAALDGDVTELAGEAVPEQASDLDLLRHRDVADLSADERRRLAALFALLLVRAPRRRTPRSRAARRGRVDARATLRDLVRMSGEPARLRHRRRGSRARPVVLVVDVSGSMSAYADALLRLAHRLTQELGAVETFTVGTRLTRLTPALRLRDADRALVAAGETVPDWSGGTRLGDSLGYLLDRWGQHAWLRGAVVVVCSDGWERGDPAQLSGQVERLGRLARRVVWVSPHRGKVGYEPVQQGVLAVLPHVDDFLAGHSLATYAELCEVIARA